MVGAILLFHLTFWENSYCAQEIQCMVEINIVTNNSASAPKIELARFFVLQKVHTITTAIGIAIGWGGGEGGAMEFVH